MLKTHNHTTKPIVSYYSGNDPTKTMNNADSWINKLTEVNVITTKTFTSEFIDFCILNKHRIFLHVVINGMGKSLLEPNIPSVKEMFVYVSTLIKRGFPQKQILIIVNPILSNDNGLKSLTLLLKAFTEFKLLRLRYIKFQLLTYKNVEDFKKNKTDESPHIIGTHKSHYTKNKYVIANQNILKRQSTKGIMGYLNKTSDFQKAYWSLLRKYESIITIDTGDEPLIGVRELMPFGYNNSWTNPDGTTEKIITYPKGKHKPNVKYLNQESPVRCINRCLLCQFRQ